MSVRFLTDEDYETLLSLIGGGGVGSNGVGIESIEQTITSVADGGINVITITFTDGSTSSFEVRNGSGGSSSGGDGVGIESVEQTTTSTADGGVNVITITLTDGSTSTFEVRNGSGGSSSGGGGVGIASVEQTTTSTADGGKNIITVTKTDGTSHTFEVLNGSKGSKGDSYVLTNEDKTSIASSVKSSLSSETWTFTLANGSTVTKKVVLG